ncbi:hypothetical protein ACFQ3P_41890 [Paraburkholderia sabiae]|uniref:Uncharacterized protein n=1 Tax=Paraburkholderia sabiae TaxID=273251 RepID=A0ABU9QS72_9BURK|nr:hypothetical protein [Paraburkholderia sabiae]WJZ72172.1 hypothetical protein QEN71_18510 [Paraburkholderia sabiae]CAD6563128.1 hypothetical protein LMG24235_08370 [Paraburkholderia sabiae]
MTLMFDYRGVDREQIPVCVCDRCGRRMHHTDPEHAEKQSLAWRTGMHSIFGDGRNIRVDLCQHCLRRVLGLWLQISEPPSEDERRAFSQAFRDELLARDWPDSERVAARLGVSSQDAAAYVHRLRTERIILGVWSRPRRRYVYPDFQFDREGRPIPDVATLLTILPDRDAESGGWENAFWLYWPCRVLDGAKPADVFAEDPKRVIDAATGEFRQPKDAAW